MFLLTTGGKQDQACRHHCYGGARQGARHGASNLAHVHRDREKGRGAKKITRRRVRKNSALLTSALSR
jgi:hypothetical protein